MSSEPLPEFDWVSFYNSIAFRVREISRCFRNNDWFTYTRHGRTLVHARRSRLFGSQLRYTYTHGNRTCTALSGKIMDLGPFIGSTAPTFSDMAAEGFDFRLTTATIGSPASDTCFNEKVTFSVLRELQEKLPYAEPVQVLGVAVDRLRRLRMGQ